jgi:two-component system, NarL family, nitrate/nitrite response regulator NarL
MRCSCKQSALSGHILVMGKRVLLCDNQPLFRGALSALLDARGFTVTGAVASAAEALPHLRNGSAPDLAIIDVELPDVPGVTLIREAVRERSPARFLVVSACSDPRVMYEALHVGAAGYLLKTAQPAEIVEAAASISRGGSTLDPAATASLISEIRRRGADTDRPALSRREYEVLNHLSEGRSAPEIASTLYLAASTVRSHLNSLYAKLGVRDRAAAVAQAMRLGLID